MEIKNADVYHDYLNGVMEGKQVEKSTKLYRDAKSFYKDVDSNLADETVMYEVYTMSKGQLNYGLTVMKPVLVCGECNMTRGHFHENLECDEIYCCMHGNGLLLLMDEEGYCHAERMRVGSVHYINGHLAHRLVNIGDDELKVQCIWPSVSGHDYERIEKHPFSVRIFKNEDEIRMEEQ